MVAARVQADRLFQLIAHRVHRVERGHRVLKNDGNLIAADFAHFAFARADQLLAAELDAAAYNAARMRENLQNGVGGHTLTRTGFPHNTKHLAAIQIEGNPIDGLHFAGRCEKGGVQIPNFQHCHTRTLPYERSLGSNASRNPLPSRLNERTIRKIESAGNNSRYG